MDSGAVAFITAISGLLVGLLGKEFVGRFLLIGQERQSDVTAAVIQLATSSSAAQIELSREAVGAMREMTVSLTQMASAMNGHETDETNRFQFVRDELREIGVRVGRVEDRVVLVEGRVEALVTVLGVNDDQR